MRYKICLLFLLFNISAYSEVGDRHFEMDGGFSFCAPEGWKFKDFPGMKFQIAFGPKSDSFSPNMNIVDEANKASLDSYAEESIRALKTAFQQFKLIKREKFLTDSKIPGEKIITNSLQRNKLLRQTFYIFLGSKGKFLVFTCSCLAENGEKLDTVFEESLKTFDYIK